MFPQISKVEYKILCIVALIMIVLGAAPYIVGHLKTPAGQFFLGTSPFNIADQPVYYTYIEQVKNGSWTNFDFYTPEKQGRGIFQISWFTPGVLARFLSVSAIAAFHIWRIFLVPILVFVLYLFVSLFFADRFSRLLAFFLALFGSGWGAYFMPFSSVYSSPKFLPLDLWVPESNTFLSLMLTPHFILSLIFLILVFYFLVLYLKSEKIFYSIFSGLSASILFSFHPYFVPLVYLILGLNAPLIIWRKRKIFNKKILGMVLIFIFSLPPVIFHFYFLSSDYVLRMRGVEMQESNFMPAIFAVVIGYGFFGLSGLLGAARNFRNASRPEWLIAYLWLFLNIALFFVPFAFPRRLTEGFQIPLALFSVVFLIPVFENMFKLGLKRFIFVLALAALILMPTAALNLSRFFAVYYLSKNNQPFFYRQDKITEAMQWFRNNSPEETVILAEPWNGNILPAFSLRRVFFGHMDETLFAASRKKEADWFFKDNGDDELKKIFLKKENVDYIFWSEREDSLGTFKPDDKGYLSEVYENDKAKVYKVVEL